MNHDLIFDSANNLICSEKCLTCKILTKYGRKKDNELIYYPISVKSFSQIKFPRMNTKREIIIPNEKISRIFLRTLSFCFIKKLIIDNNKIKELPSIHSLECLSASNCGLKEIPKELLLLKELNIEYNELKHIPKYPLLQKLCCSHNMITSITPMEKLKTIRCNKNKLNDIYAPNAKYIEAYNNPLTTIYYIPSLIRRSSVMIQGSISYINQVNIKHNSNIVLINWNNPNEKILQNIIDLLLK